MLSDSAGKRLCKYVPDYVLFDLETTGLSAMMDEVIEISAVKVKNGKVVDEFSSLVNPGRRIPYAASSVNGITDAMVKDSPFFEEVLEKFLEFCGDSILAGHNIHSFDMKFINRDANKYWGKCVGNDYVDTLYFSRNVLPHLAKHSLGYLSEHYGISTEGAHRALADCHMNHKVYEALAKDMENGTVQARTCPKCKQLMKLRKGRFGEFWGCMGYPECRYTENF